MKILFLLLTCFSSLVTYTGDAQVIVRDHRTGTQTKYIPRPYRPRPSVSSDNSDLQPIPETIGGFRIDPQFRDELNFNGNGWGPLSNNNNKVFFSNKLVFGNGGFASSPSEAARELIFFADTLFINGQFNIDLSANLNNSGNGFLMISCRVLKLAPGAQLKVDLSNNQQYHFRKFYFFTEQVYNDNSKVFDEAKAITNCIKVKKSCNGHWERLRPGQTQMPIPPECSYAGFQPRPGFNFVVKPHNPLVAAVGFLPVMSETHEDFFKFFSQWVVASYQNLFDKIIRDVNRMDKIPVVKHFIKFLALNNYSQLESSSQSRSSQLIVQINQYKDQIFKDGYQFERTLTIDGKPQILLGTVTESSIVNYLPPSVLLVNTSQINQRVIAGYAVFDETQPDKTIIDFDISLYTDSRLRQKVAEQLRAANESLNTTFEGIRFTNLLVEGPDVVPAMTRISTLSNNGFNIRLVVNNNSAILFNRLFSPISSDIFITGKWGNKMGTIGGDFRVPVGFAKVVNPMIEPGGGSLINKSGTPVTVEFFKNRDQIQFLSPAIQIEGGASYPSVYSGEDRHIQVVPDGVTLRLNPERFGDYFEQIDNSDKLVQELFIENHISASSPDSLSGFLQSVELTVSYSIGSKNIERKIQLSPADALGSSYNILIPKSSKDPVSITIRGRAIYQNGEYAILPQTLSNGEAEFNLEIKHLANVPK